MSSPASRPLADLTLALRLVRHLAALQSEDGSDAIGQETSDLMFAVMRRFGLRTKLVQHDPVPACEFTGQHNVVECGHDGMPWDFEVDPSRAAPEPPDHWAEECLQMVREDLEAFGMDMKGCPPMMYNDALRSLVSKLGLRIGFTTTQEIAAFVSGAAPEPSPEDRESSAAITPELYEQMLASARRGIVGDPYSAGKELVDLRIEVARLRRGAAASPPPETQK